MECTQNRCSSIAPFSSVSKAQCMHRYCSIPAHFPMLYPPLLYSPPKSCPERSEGSSIGGDAALVAGGSLTASCSSLIFFFVIMPPYAISDNLQFFVAGRFPGRKNLARPAQKHRALPHCPSRPHTRSTPCAKPLPFGPPPGSSSPSTRTETVDAPVVPVPNASARLGR